MSGIEWSESAKAAKGGTELMARELERRIPPELLNKFQIFLAHVLTPMDPTKIRIFWAHNLPGPNGHTDPLENKGWARFHKIVFVSDWQMQEHINRYKIPWSRCQVLPNAIIPIPAHTKPTPSPIRLIYTPTPFRGLIPLYMAFNKLCEKYDDIELSVFSSFKLYGEPAKDAPYERLFKILKKHPKVHYYGTVENSVLRKHLEQSHIFAYPTGMKETSCLCLIEAMSAGLICVHPRYGALSETAANWNLTYQWHEDSWKHVNEFYIQLENALNLVRNHYEIANEKLQDQIKYAKNFYSWDVRAIEWELFLRKLLNPSPLIISPPPNNLTLDKNL